MPIWLVVGAVLGVVFAGQAFGRGADVSSGSPGETVDSVWVSIRSDRGRVRDARAEDLRIRVGDDEVPVLDVTDGAGTTRTVVWIDPSLAGSGTLRRGLQALAGVASELAELGLVEIVQADPEAGVVLTSREPLALGEHFGRTALTMRGESRILAVRQAALAALATPERTSPSSEGAVELTARAVAEEVRTLRERHDELLAWASAASSSTDGDAHDDDGAAQRLLILLSDGFDPDPLVFYSGHLEEEPFRRLAQAAVDDVADLDRSVEETTRSLAALGWTVVPLSVESADADALGGGVFESPDLVTGESNASGVATVRPGRLFGRDDDEDENPTPRAELVAGGSGLALFADATGGVVLRSAGGLRELVQRLPERRRVVFAPPPGDGALLPLEIAAREDGTVVRGPRWWSAATPAPAVAVRLRRLADGAESVGLEVSAALSLVEQDPVTASGDLRVRIDLRTLDLEPEVLGDVEVRVAAVVEGAGEPARLVETWVPGQDLRGRADWTHDMPLTVPTDDARVAVAVEVPELGLWGGTRASVSYRSTGDADVYLPPPTVVEIRRPGAGVLRGRVRFEADVYDHRVEWVDFLLDGEAEERQKGSPWAARIDLGRDTRARELTAVAYDGDGVEVGRDTVVVNGGRADLSVEILDPGRTKVTGPVEIEARVAVPLERELDRVLFFWNSDLVGTVYAPPYRHRVVVPETAPIGYVRVVALLADGTLAEDVLFLNGPASAERLDVNLVELYTVVTDRRGRPVDGLAEDDFTVFENGRRQELAGFSAADDLPLTLGLAIDSSSSMFVKLPGVQAAASRFLRSTFGDADRGFVVGFASTPTLVHGTTSDLPALLRAVDRLQPEGRTALWESIVYSLVQLQGVAGRKALVVFSDGADEDDKFPFRSAQEVARRMGVPVYLILMDQAPEEGNLSLFGRSFASRVDKLTSTTGGRVFYAREYDDLGQVYDEIERELRSQYLLTYYSDQNGRSGWRDVDVEVEGRGLVPRTLSGYWPR